MKKTETKRDVPAERMPEEMELGSGKLSLHVTKHALEIVGEGVEAIDITAKTFAAAVTALVVRENRVDSRTVGVEEMGKMKVAPGVFAEAVENDEHALGRDAASLMMKCEELRRSVGGDARFPLREPGVGNPGEALGLLQAIVVTFEPRDRIHGLPRDDALDYLAGGGGKFVEAKAESAPILK